MTVKNRIHIPIFKMTSQPTKTEIFTVRPTKPSLRINPNGKHILEPLEGTASTPLKDLILTPHPNHYLREGDVTFVVCNLI